jgi:pimeloyl-ACP methyl ester carboxylesterase
VARRRPLVDDRLGCGVRPLGAGPGPNGVLLHGYPPSSFDYRMVLPHLGDRAWVTTDFPGFGLSHKPRPHSYSLLKQADLVETVIAEQTSGPVVLIAHDMGTWVTTELLARDLQGRLRFELQRVVLSNGSVILHRASLRPIQKVLRGRLGLR